MAFDLLGWGIVAFFLFWIAGSIYRKKFGQPISELWRNTGSKAQDIIDSADYRRFYVTKGIKQ